MTNEVEIANNGGEQFIEIMSESAGELADRLHLHRLPERGFGFDPLRGLYRFRYDAHHRALAVLHGAQCQVEAALTIRQIYHNGMLADFTCSSRGHRLAHRLRHSRRLSKPRRLPKRPPDNIFYVGLYAFERGAVSVEKRPVGGHVALKNIRRLQKCLHTVGARLERFERARQSVA